MADKTEALEWAVIPPSSATRSIVPDVDHDYDIFDAKIGAALVYGERRFGINLVWGDAATPNNVRFASQPVSFSGSTGTRSFRRGIDAT